MVNDGDPDGHSIPVDPIHAIYRFQSLNIAFKDQVPRLFDTLYDDTLAAISSWQPGYHRTEPEYSDELAGYLRRALRQSGSLLSLGPPRVIAIERESGRGLCDVVVNRRIGIELKKDFRGKGELDRLRGQLDDYVNAYQHTVILLVGTTDPGTLDSLKLKVLRLNSSSGLQLTPTPTVRIILK